MGTKNLKAIAAQEALSYIADGMRLGLGTGSTVDFFLQALASKLEKGLKIYPVVTSLATARRCHELGIKIYDLNDLVTLDLAIDGADEIDPNLSLIKGGGGALWWEKIVAQAAEKFIIIADETKLVKSLGSFPLPIEVAKFGWQATAKAIEKLFLELAVKAQIKLRSKDEQAFITDNHHYILDIYIRDIALAPGASLDLSLLDKELLRIAGVVEHGLFLNIADIAIIGKAPSNIEYLTIAGDK